MHPLLLPVQDGVGRSLRIELHEVGTVAVRRSGERLGGDTWGNQRSTTARVAIGPAFAWARSYREVVFSSSAALAALAGLGLGLSLIVAIGAQNAFVLRQGLLLEHVGAVVAVCAASDAVLIGAGVLGAGALLLAHPELLTVVCFGGAAFLLTYGAMAARRALRPADTLAADVAGVRTGLAVTVLTCLALTWLNPHVYLDTVVLLGSLSATHGGDRWWFAAGAATGSVLWFAGLGFGARLLRPVFARPAAWRVLDVLIAVVMTTLGVSLAVRGLTGG